MLSTRRFGRSATSECRSQIKENLKAREMPCLKTKLALQTVVRGYPARANRRDKLRPVNLIPEVDTNRPNRRTVAKANPHGVREIVQLIGAVELALRGICGIKYRCR